MQTASTDVQPQELRTFNTKEDAIAFLQSIAQPDTIIIITPPPH